MVCHRYYPDIGGVETHVREISERLVKRGFEVEVICTDPSGKYPEHECHNGVRIRRFRSFAPSGAFFFSPQMYFYLKNKGFEIIHTHNYHAFPSFFASAAAKGRFIFTPHYHGGSHSTLRNILLKPYRWFGSFIFKRAEKIVCVSKYEMDLIKNDFNVPRSKLVKIPNGLNLKEFTNIKELIKKGKTILYAGRLESYKGVQYLIEALPLLLEYRLIVIGSGNYEKKLHELAKKLNVDDRIEWLKDLERKDLLSHFISADVFVNLSIFEAYGITVAEALACGTSCIVAKGGALEEFIDDDGCVGMSYPVDINILINLIKSGKKISPRKMPDWEEVTSDLIGVYST